MDMADQEINEKIDKQLKCVDELLNKIGHLIAESDCDEGDVLVIATIFLARTVHGISPFLPIASGPADGPMITLENVDDLLKTIFDQVKSHLERYRKEDRIH